MFRVASLLLALVVLSAASALALELAAFTFAAPPSPSPAPVTWPAVARVFFADRQDLDRLAGQLDIWQVHHAESYLVVLLQPDQYLGLLAAGCRIEIDEARTAELNRPRSRLPDQTNGIPGYPCYRTVEETYATAQAIVAAHPNLATWLDIGDSWEKTQNPLNGYNLQVLRLTNSAIPGPKPKLFVTASIHGSEYAPAELNTRFAEYLVNNYGVDPDVTWLLDYQEVHLMLQSNPDGRHKAETGLPWRKNTNNNYCANTNDRGADLNRNYDFQWGCCGGSSGNQCNTVYRGPSPASEPETQAVQGYVYSQFPDQRPDDQITPAPLTSTGVLIDLHSYGELVMWSWGFTGASAPNGAALQTFGRKLAFFNNYTPEQSYQNDITEGTTKDFAYGRLGVAAFTFELGTDFFQDCPTFNDTIVPANRPALLYAAKAARRPYQTPAGPDSLQVTVSVTSVVAGQPVTLTAISDDTHYAGGEPTRNIAAARYTIDAPAWITGVVRFSMAAADGTLDSPVETVRAVVNTSGWTPGRHLLFVESQAATGNWGVPTAVFLWIAAVPNSAIVGTVRSKATGAPIEGANVHVVGGALDQRQVTGRSGSFAFAVSSGTYTVTASAYGYQPATITGVQAMSGTTTTLNISLTLAANYCVSGTVGDAITGWPLYARINIAGHPGGGVWNDPVTGFYSVTLNSEFFHTFNVDAWAAGYLTLTRALGVLTGDRTENLSLISNTTTCQAPGYQRLSAVVCAPQVGGLVVGNTYDAQNLAPLAGATVSNDSGRSTTTLATPDPLVPDSFYTLFSPPGSRAFTATMTYYGSVVTTTMVILSNTVRQDFHLPAYGVLLTPAAARPGDPGSFVSYTLRLTNTGLTTDTCSVSVGGNAWSTTLSTPVGPLAGGKSASVFVTVTVPSNALGGARDVAYITARSQGNPNKSATSVLTTTANRINGVMLTPVSMTSFGPVGATITFTLRVTNTGNVSDVFNVVTTGNTWAVAAPMTTGLLSAGVGVNLNIRVNIPLTATNGASDIATATVNSQGNPARSARSTLTTTVKNVYGVMLTPGADSQVGNPGVMVTYMLRLTNIGDAVDTFMLSKSATVWTTDVLASVGSLAAKAITDVQALVHIPSSTNGGATDAVTVTATSTGDATKSAAATLTTTANAVYGVTLAPPIASQSGAPGTAVTYTLRVTNTSNTTDTLGFAYTGNAWVVQLPVTRTRLAARAGADVIVRVTIPVTATAGRSDAVRVTASGTGASASSLLTTSAVAYQIFVPLVMEPSPYVPGRVER